MWTLKRTGVNEKMKNLLVENLLSHGFTESEDARGNLVFEKKTPRTVRAGFYGDVETSRIYIFSVKIDPKTSACTVIYHSPAHAPVSVEYKKASKAVWNAISKRATTYYGLTF